MSGWRRRCSICYRICKCWNHFYRNFNFQQRTSCKQHNKEGLNKTSIIIMVAILFIMGWQVPDVIKTFWKNHKTAAGSLCQEDNHQHHHHHHHCITPSPSSSPLPSSPSSQHHRHNHQQKVLVIFLLLCLLDGWVEQVQLSVQWVSDLQIIGWLQLIKCYLGIYHNASCLWIIIRIVKIGELKWTALTCNRAL